MNSVGLVKRDLLDEVDNSRDRLNQLKDPVAGSLAGLAGVLIAGLGIGYCIKQLRALPIVKVTQYSWVARKEIEVLQFANRKLGIFWSMAGIMPGIGIWGGIGAAAGTAVHSLVELVFKQMKRSVGVRKAHLAEKYGDRQTIEPRDLRHALYLLDRQSLAAIAPQMNFSQLAVFQGHVGPRFFSAHVGETSPASKMWKWLLDLPTRTDTNKIKEEIASPELQEAFRDPYFRKAFCELAPPSVKPTSVWLDWREQSYSISDVTLVVEGRGISANKERLTKHSGYFKQLFSQNFAEGTQDRIVLEELSFKEVELFVGVVQGTIPDLTEQLCRDLLGITSFFLNDKLAESIESYVIAHRGRFSDEECFNIVANFQQCDRLKKILEAELLRKGFPVYGLQEDAELIEKCKLEGYRAVVAKKLKARFRQLVQPAMQELVGPLNERQQLVGQLLQNPRVQSLGQSAAVYRLTQQQGKLNQAIQDLSHELRRQGLVRSSYTSGRELVEVLRPLHAILGDKEYEFVIKGTPVNENNLPTLDQYATETEDGALKEACLNFVLVNLDALRKAPPWEFGNIPDPYGELLYPSHSADFW